MENPEVLWAQSMDKIFLTLKVEEQSNYDIILMDNFIEVNNLDSNNIFRLEFLKNINKDESVWKKTGNKIEIVIAKNVPIFWEKLSDKKYNNLKIDWNRWQDEEEFIDEGKRQILHNFDDFKKTLPSELMEKDFTELFNTQENGLPDLRNIDEEIMTKMEEGRITKKDRESLSSPEEEISNDEEISNEEDIIENDNENQLEDEFKQV